MRKSLKISKHQSLKALALALALASSAQTTEREVLEKSFKRLTIAGPCTVDIVRAEECAIEYPAGAKVEHDDGSVSTSFSYLPGNHFTILDTLERHYTIYYDRDTLPRLMLPDPETIHRIKLQGVAVRRIQAIGDLEVTDHSIAFKLLPEPKNEVVEPEPEPKGKTTYDRGARMRMGCHFGISNWGSAPLAGLFGTSDPVYQVSSPGGFNVGWEVAEDFRLSYHWRAAAGIGIDLTILRFKDRYLTPVGGGLAEVENPIQGVSYDQWHTSLALTNLYVPLSLGWRDGTDKWEFYCTLMPTFHLHGKWNLLSHIGTDADSQLTYVTKAGTPAFSLQARLEARWRIFSLYTQTYLTPVYRDPAGPKLFPATVGIGFML